MKKQVIVIHGGDAFDTYEDYIAFLKDFQIESLESLKGKRWKDSLQENLGPDFDVLLLRMPSTLNVRYLEWKIWFDKIVPLMNDEVILVGHSQGALFLIKYLSENNISKKVLGLHLVSAPFDTEGSDGWTLGDFTLPENFDNASSQAEKIYFYHSKDDDIVPISHLTKYKKYFPNAEEVIFEDRGHFNQPDFPELVENIKNN